MEIKFDGDGAARIRRRRDWSVDDFDAMEIRRSSSTKFDGAGVYQTQQRPFTLRSRLYNRLYNRLYRFEYSYNKQIE